MSPRKAAKKAAFKAAKRHGDRPQGIWLDETAVLDEPNDQLNPPMGSGPDRNEARIERAVTEAMSKAARAGLGNRGRIRAGQRAMSKEQARIDKERGR